jgi:hypothetical protein
MNSSIRPEVREQTDQVKEHRRHPSEAAFLRPGGTTIDPSEKTDELIDPSLDPVRPNVPDDGFETFIHGAGI